MLASVTAVTPCEVAPTQLRRAEYASDIVQTDAWPQTCALSGPSPVVHAENVGERHRKSAVQDDMVNHMVGEPSNLCEVSSGTSATSDIPGVVRPQTPHAQLLRAVEVLREAALSFFNKQSWSPSTTREACDLLREACELLRLVPCELVPAHLQHRGQTREDTGRGVEVTESVDYLRQLESDLWRDRHVVKFLQQTREYTSLYDSVLPAVDCRSQPKSVLS